MSGHRMLNYRFQRQTTVLGGVLCVEDNTCSLRALFYFYNKIRESRVAFQDVPAYQVSWFFCINKATYTETKRTHVRLT